MERSCLPRVEEAPESPLKRLPGLSRAGVSLNRPRANDMWSSCPEVGRSRPGGCSARPALSRADGWLTKQVSVSCVEIRRDNRPFGLDWRRFGEMESEAEIDVRRQ